MAGNSGFSSQQESPRSSGYHWVDSTALTGSILQMVMVIVKGYELTSLQAAGSGDTLPTSSIFLESYRNVIYKLCNDVRDDTL